MGASAMLPGAAGNEQTGAGQIALSLVGVGSRKYTNQTKMWNLATDLNRHGDLQAQKYQAARDAEARGDSIYRRLSNLLEAGDQDKAATEYDALVKAGTTPAQMEAHYDAVNRPFTGNQAREVQFGRPDGRRLHFGRGTRYSGSMEHLLQRRPLATVLGVLQPVSTIKSPCRSCRASAR